MPIYPLPQFEADLEADRLAREEAQRAAEAAAGSRTLVVRFGFMRLIGEYNYDGDLRPGCGSKMVVRSHRGTELAELLTTTCPNSGCAKSVSRQEMLDFIENSGGKDYPFFREGRVLRLATIDDLNAQARIENSKHALVRDARDLAGMMRLEMKIVEAEPILGGERIIFHFTAEQRVDFRDLVHELSRKHGTRIDMHQVGARDEARLTADYEKCGQHCCCRQFLKVLKPVSIKAAKTQKATLDPLKISGRCGRLMCCLRYEEQTYDELVARLPRLKRRVGTHQGAGMVIDRQILTQLVLVKLEHDGAEIAVPVEDLIPPEEAPVRSAPTPIGPPTDSSALSPARPIQPSPAHPPPTSPAPRQPPPETAPGDRTSRAPRDAGQGPQPRPAQPGPREPDGRGQRAPGQHQEPGRRRGKRGKGRGPIGGGPAST